MKQRLDPKLYDLTWTRATFAESKDKKTVEIRISDPTGLGDMKIYLSLRAKLLQMEIALGIHDEHPEEL